MCLDTRKMNFPATIVRIAHLSFVAWMIYAPFSNDRHVLLAHAVVCPFLVLHWITNSDGGCALTLLEKKLRGVDDDRSFVHSIVAPIYVIKDSTLKKIVLGVTLVLWAITLAKLTSRKTARGQ